MKYLRSQSSLEMKAGWHPRFSFYECSFFPLFLLEYNCFTMLLVSAVQWSESPICIHLSPCSWASSQHPPYLIPAGHHRAKLYSGFPLAIYFTHGSVCVCVCMPVQISQLSPSPSHLPMPTCLFCMAVSLFHPANRFICTIFLKSTYVH